MSLPHHQVWMMGAHCPLCDGLLESDPFVEGKTNEWWCRDCTALFLYHEHDEGDVYAVFSRFEDQIATADRMHEVNRGDTP